MKVQSRSRSDIGSPRRGDRFIVGRDGIAGITPEDCPWGGKALVVAEIDAQLLLLRLAF